MPENTRVHKIYKALLREGMSEERAAKIAQARTKQSLKTGRAPKSRRKR